MIEWPGRCSHCKQQIEDWSDAGAFEGRWIHKDCWAETQPPAVRGAGLARLLSPVDRSKTLEWPMLISMLLFHFGLGAGFIGWIMLTQTSSSDAAGALVLVIGLVTPIIGVAGVALNVMARRRIELVRVALDNQGGWKPGR